MLKELYMPGRRTYNDGRPYFVAKGRKAPRKAIENRVTTVHPIINGYPTTDEFLNAVKREMKIRFYSPQSIKQYMSHLRRFLAWFGDRPNRICIESVRQFLEILVDGGASSSTLAGHLAAIRMAFDKFCDRNETLGLQTPRQCKDCRVFQIEMRSSN